MCDITSTLTGWLRVAILLPHPADAAHRLSLPHRGRVGSIRAGGFLHQAVGEFDAFVEGGDADAFVAAVGAAVVDVAEEAGDAIGRDAGHAEEDAVRRAGAHRWDHRHI